MHKVSFVAVSVVCRANALDDRLLWISGKSDPIRKTVNGKVEGTKKDPPYIRCLNDCIPRLQGKPSLGIQKDRTDVLAECQDTCCFTYQQCTTNMRMRQ